MRSALVVVATVAASVLTEYIMRGLGGQTISDLSAAVTGLLLALNLHHTHMDSSCWGCNRNRSYYSYLAD